MKKYIKLSILLILMLLVLTGCTNTEYNVSVKSNGKGTTECIIKFDEDILKNEYNTDLSGIESFNFFDTITKNAEKNGYKVEKIEKDGKVSSCKITREFENIAEDFKIQESVGEEYISITDDTGIKVEKNFFITKYSGSFTADTNIGGEVINKIKLTYRFPKGISTTNGKKEFSLTNCKFSYELGSYEMKKIEYTVYSFNAPLIIIIVVAIIIIAFVIFKIFKRKKHK